MDRTADGAGEAAVAVVDLIKVVLEEEEIMGLTKEDEVGALSKEKEEIVAPIEVEGGEGVGPIKVGVDAGMVPRIWFGPSVYPSL